ncbi:hypothetical protein [Acinetobacter sp. ANC 4558]|uniref:hypothetical protein n=1 Tax=Acinetobacter sp. ANC 4558 TaxID=1977876 RepID=UPI00148A6892|nr:hypothetical protein [Acinetobacter sp. ANC 4558]
MLKRIMMIIISLSVLSGCVTTKALVSNISSKKSTIKTPLEQILKAHPELQLELSNLDIRQVFNKVEGPTAAQVTIVQSNLLDDSITAIRTTYRFKLHQNIWQQLDTVTEFKCMRGKNITDFQKQYCL